MHFYFALFGWNITAPKSLTECNSGTTQNCPFGFNTSIDLENTTTTSDITGIIVS